MKEWLAGTAGFERVVEVGIRLAPTAGSSSQAAEAISRVLETGAGAPVRIVGLGAEDGRVIVTLAVTLGTPAQITSADPAARSAIALLERLVSELAAFDPAFTALPDPDSIDARIAHGVQSDPGTFDRAVGVLSGQVA